MFEAPIRPNIKDVRHVLGVLREYMYSAEIHKSLNQINAVDANEALMKLRRAEYNNKK